MTFFIFLLACAAAASTGVIFKPGAWYESLVKPSFTPPNWLFPVAWTIIYLLLAWAGYRLTLIPGSESVGPVGGANCVEHPVDAGVLWCPSVVRRDGDYRALVAHRSGDGAAGRAPGFDYRPDPVSVSGVAVRGRGVELLDPA